MGDDRDEDADVISLATGKPVGLPEPTREDDRRRFCGHQGWAVSVHERSLHCRQCGVDLDPFEVLARVAEEYDTVVKAREEHKRLREHIGRLQHEEKRTKARLKNASRKDADAAVQEERERWQKRCRHLRWRAQEIERAAVQIARGLGAPKRDG